MRIGRIGIVGIVGPINAIVQSPEGEIKSVWLAEGYKVGDEVRNGIARGWAVIGFR